MSMFLLIAALAQAATATPMTQSPAVAIAPSAADVTAPQPTPDDSLIETAAKLLGDGKPAEAIALAELPSHRR